MNITVLGLVSLMLLVLVSVLVLAGKIISRRGKLSVSQKKWWLIIHIFFVITAFSGLLGQLLAMVATASLAGREQLQTAHHLIVLLDDYLIVPGSFGSLVTGVWLAVRTNWGFARYYWIIAKWAGNLAAILLGVALIGSSIHHAFPQALAGALHPWQNPAYLHGRQIMCLGLATGLAIYAFLVVISVLKPKAER